MKASINRGKIIKILARAWLAPAIRGLKQIVIARDPCLLMPKNRWISRKTRKQGYVLIRDHGILKCPYAWQDGRIYEHAFVIWQAGIPYDPAIHVIHHKNGNRADNRLENLAVLPREAHALFSLFTY